MKATEIVSPKALPEDPIQALRYIIGRDGCAFEVEKICGRNPDAAAWLVKQLEHVYEKSAQFGRPTARLEKYVRALDSAMISSSARSCGCEILFKIDKEMLGDSGTQH